MKNNTAPSGAEQLNLAYWEDIAGFPIETRLDINKVALINTLTKKETYINTKLPFSEAMLQAIKEIA